MLRRFPCTLVATTTHTTTTATITMANVRHSGDEAWSTPRGRAADDDKCRQRDRERDRPDPVAKRQLLAGPPGAEGAARTGATSRSMAGPGAVSRTRGPRHAAAQQCRRACRPTTVAASSRPGGSGDPWSKSRSPTTQPAAAQPIRSRTGMRSRERTGSRARSPPHRARGADVMSGSKADRPAAPRSPRTRRANCPPDQIATRPFGRIRKRSGLLLPYHGMGEDRAKHRSFVEWPGVPRPQHRELVGASRSSVSSRSAWPR